MSDPTADDRGFAPAAARNRDAILAVFQEHMPLEGRILEVASGTGEHAVHLAAALPRVQWWPGDPDERARSSIDAWIAHAGLDNVAPPHATDAASAAWPVDDAGPFAGIVSINMIHIAPFDAARGLFAGAGRLLRAGGRLFLYGPFLRDGRQTAPSNAAFDSSLKKRDPRWGVRDLEGDLLPLAAAHGLALAAVVPMPANNFSVVFERL